MRSSLLLGAFLFYSALASAAPMSSFGFSCITNNNAADCDIGEAQLRMSVSDIGNDEVAFRFENFGPAASSITHIYFDDEQPGSHLTYDRMQSSTGVSFDWGSASPGNLPGWSNIDFHTTKGFLADADAPKSKKGINPSEWLDIIFLTGCTEFKDLIDRLNNGDLRVGLHVQAFRSGGSESFVNTPIPTPVPLPAAGWLMLSGLLPWLAFSKGRGRA